MPDWALNSKPSKFFRMRLQRSATARIMHMPRVASAAQVGFEMQVVRTYPTRVEADLDRIALEAAGIACVVVGIGADMEGGIAGVKLLVPEEQVGRATEILERR